MDMTRVFGEAFNLHIFTIYCRHQGSLLLRMLLTFGLSSAVSYLATMADPMNEPVAHQATSLVDTVSVTTTAFKACI